MLLALIAGPVAGVIRIDPDVVVIVDVPLEIGLGPIVEAFREQEAAASAAAVVHGNAEWRQLEAALLLAWTD